MRSKQHPFEFNTSIAFPISALILLILVLIAINAWQSAPEEIPSSTTAILLPIPKKINSFHLTTTDAKEFSQKNFGNHWTLLYFGYTHSDTTCPNTLSLLNRIYNTLQLQYPNLQVLFVSLDPERDTLDDIKDFTTSFNKSFIGATGTTEELDNLKEQLGVIAKRNQPIANSGSYQINHSNNILLINPQAELKATIPATARLDEIRLTFEEITEQSSTE